MTDVYEAKLFVFIVFAPFIGSIIIGLIIEIYKKIRRKND